jgi:hypothetical protein
MFIYGPISNSATTLHVQILPIGPLSIMNLCIPYTEHDGTQHYDPQHNDTQHNNTEYGATERYSTKHGNIYAITNKQRQNIATILGVVMLNVICSVPRRHSTYWS